MLAIDPSLLIYGLSGILVFLVIWIIRLDLKINTFTRGKNGKSLEGSIVTIKKDQDDLAVFRTEMENYLTRVEERLKRSVQSTETVRFNPFKGDGSGGNQSFVSVFLNENGDGVILSSLYARDRISIFSKPIKNFTSEFELSEEEKKVIDDAKRNLN